MAIKAVKLCGLKDSLIFGSIKKIKDVNGRLELVKKYSNQVKVYVDYAHTPDALMKTLQSLKLKYGKNISIVFGCGGERDKKKRPLMAKIADQNCKKIFITDDNPRSESPQKIRNELSKYIKKGKVFNIKNRNQAIKKAIQSADFNEVILVAGKGHEEHQIYKNKIINNYKNNKNIKIKFKIYNKKTKFYSK